LAIDYGTKRTGLAVTDPGQMIASPLETVASHELMNFLKAYFDREPVEIVVVGLPRKMDNSESESMKQIRFFVAAFKKRFPSLQLAWMDERFTSSLAKHALVEGGMKKSARRMKEHVDKVSAALILQSYLEAQNNLKQ
jgi:putative Holliday junction resolvase